MKTPRERPSALRLSQSMPSKLPHPWSFDFSHAEIGQSVLVNADCIEWMSRAQENSVHAIVTDPPYGVKEYEQAEVERLRNGNRGGIWRLPPVLDGVERAPLPRFTALSPKERAAIGVFFQSWAKAAIRIARPGAHMLIASNSFLSQQVFHPIESAGWEYRGEVIRLVQTLRGGDRPKLHEKEFPNVCSLPRGCYEPWGIFRKPMPPKMRAGECLREWQTGGLRCLPDGNPFRDVIESERTPRDERAIADHPSLKPISLMRQLVYAALPLGEGVILDTFSGSGSTVAAAEIEGLSAIGIERDSGYFQMSLSAVPAIIDLRRDRQLKLI
jgi:site-specific DNA-methyltransferase (adenine-specific)